MIAYDTRVGTCPTLCTCQHCNGYFANASNCTSYYYPPVPAQKSKMLLDLERFQTMYEARLRARKMSLAPLPEPIVREPRRARIFPVRVHLLRCMNRRPRLSLRARLRQQET